MTVHGKGTVKAYFEKGDRPTSAQFADLVDSYQDRQTALDSFGSSVGAAAAFPAIVVVGASSPDVNVTAHTLATAARRAVSAAGAGLEALASATNTADLTNALGVGAVGSTIFTAETTASARNELDLTPGTIGFQLFEANTTASAQNFIELDRATTAQAVDGTKVTAYMTPDNIRFNPYAIRGFATFTSAPAVVQSQRVSSVAKNATGTWVVTWAQAMPTANYGLGGISGSKAAAAGGNAGLFIFDAATAAAKTASAVHFYSTDDTGAPADPFGHITIFALCSGQ